MIVLGLVDYLLIATVLMVLALRILSDIKDVLLANSTKKTIRAIVRKKYSPKLTIILPLESADDVKQTLQHLQDIDYPIVAIVVIDSTIHPRAAGALRYFVRKNSLNWCKVVARRQLDIPSLIREYAANGLAVVVQDTVRLHDSFYYDAILPLGDNSVDAVRLVSGVRPGKTIGGGIEALFASVRQYGGMNGLYESKECLFDEGVITRTKYAKSMPRRELKVIKDRNAAYTVASRAGSFSSIWRGLRQSSKVADYVLLIVMTLLSAALFQDMNNVLFMAGVVAVIHFVLLWWALGVQHFSLADRVSILLLSPLYYPLSWSFLLVTVVRKVAMALAWPHRSSADTI